MNFLMRRAGLAVLTALTGLAARAAEAPLVIDPAQSRVEVVVAATVDSFIGRLERYEARVVVDDAEARVVRARFAFHFADVKTGKTDRDEQMHAWQDTPTHPDGEFTLATLTRGADGGRVATGALTLHGLTKEITFPVSVTHEGALYAIDGDATLDTRTFGLPIIRKFMLLKVDPLVHVRFHLQGRADAAAKTP